MHRLRIALACALTLGCAAAAPALAQDHAHMAHADSARGRGNPADVRFMHDMIMHHGQALEMATFVNARTTRPDVRLLAERIRIAQTDEIGLMRRWLLDRGHPAPTAEEVMHEAPAADSAHAAHMAAMPGMLTPAQMVELASQVGPAFDRMFLESMIRHHEGALTMVAQLLASPGAGQDPDVYRLASDVDSGQRAEIARMRALLAAPIPRQ